MQFTCVFARSGLLLADSNQVMKSYISTSVCILIVSSISKLSYAGGPGGHVFYTPSHASSTSHSAVESNHESAVKALEPQEEQAEPEEKAEKYVVDLASPTFGVREAASRALLRWALAAGHDAVPFLEKHSKSPDAEVQMRLKRIYQRLREHLKLTKYHLFYCGHESLIQSNLSDPSEMGMFDAYLIPAQDKKHEGQWKLVLMTVPSETNPVGEKATILISKPERGELASGFDSKRHAHKVLVAELKIDTAANLPEIDAGYLTRDEIANLNVLSIIPFENGIAPNKRAVKKQTSCRMAVPD